MILAGNKSPLIKLACMAGLIAIATLAPLAVLAASFS